MTACCLRVKGPPPCLDFLELPSKGPSQTMKVCMSDAYRFEKHSVFVLIHQHTLCICMFTSELVCLELEGSLRLKFSNNQYFNFVSVHCSADSWGGTFIVTAEREMGAKLWANKPRHRNTCFAAFWVPWEKTHRGCTLARNCSVGLA